MASFTSINFNSDSDSDDDDFVPNEANGEDSSPSKGPKAKRAGKKKGKKGEKPKGISLDDEDEDTMRQKAEEEESRRLEFEKEKEEREEAAKAKKTDDLWADFLKDTAPPAAAALAAAKPDQSKKPSASTANGTATKPKAAEPKPAAKPKSAASIMSSIFDDFENKSESKEETQSETKKGDQSEKSKTDDGQGSMSIVSSIFSSAEKRVDNKKETAKSEEKTDEDGKVRITKVYDFAGESVEVSKVVDAESKEGQKFLKSQNPEEDHQPAEKGGKRPLQAGKGLSGLVSAINKKPKMGCLDKSKLDWDTYVAKEGIREELETFNKGKDGYVEKQMFLERADHRRFEQEKAAREKTRTTLNR